MSSLPSITVPEDEPSPQEQQQHMLNILRSMMSSAQQPAMGPPPAYSSTSGQGPGTGPPPLPPPTAGQAPAYLSTAPYGGGSAPVVHREVHQPSSNTGVRDTELDVVPLLDKQRHLTC